MKKRIIYMIITLIIITISIILIKHKYDNYKTLKNMNLTCNENESYTNNKTNFNNSNNFINIFKNSVDSVVHIKCNYYEVIEDNKDSEDDDDILNYFFSDMYNKINTTEDIGHGAGIIISPDGYIITNYHIVKNASKITISLVNNEKYNGKVIGFDSETDIALIKINRKNLKCLYLGDSDKIKIGEWVAAIGNPFNLDSTLTTGIISGINRNLELIKLEKKNKPVESFIQTDTVINPGNSGGPLINNSGKVIGMNTSILSKSGFCEGYGFAVPSNIIKKIVSDILKFNDVKRVHFGIHCMDMTDENIIEEYNRKNKMKIIPQLGVLICEIKKNSILNDTEIKKGDIIKKINNTLIHNISEMNYIISSKYPGDLIELMVLHDNKIKKYIIILEK